MYFCKLFWFAEIVDAVYLDKSLKHWKSLINVERSLISSTKNSSDVHFITWLCDINIISKQYDLLASRNTTWSYLGWRLLQICCLVVAIDRSVVSNSKGPRSMARVAITKFCFCILMNKEGVFDVSTSSAFKRYLSKLIHESTLIGDNSFD